MKAEINMKNKVTVTHEHDEYVIMTENNGVAVVRQIESGMTTEYYKRRANTDLSNDEMWEELLEGEVVYKNWNGAYDLTMEMIRDAVAWLGCNSDIMNVEFKTK